MAAPVQQTDDEILPGFRRLAWNSGYGLTVGPLYEKDTEDGSYVRAFRVGPHHTNMLNNCHGGMLMGFADVAFGHVISHKTGLNWVTVRLVIDFVASPPLGAWVEGAGKLTGEDGDFRHIQGRIWVGDTTIATGTGIFKVWHVKR